MLHNKIAIIGLGYVGLPLALAFGEKFTTIGFDINKNFNLHSLICYFIIVEKGSTLSYY